MTDIELPSIPRDANKYTRGSLLVLAGSRRYPGAAVLTALAAARSGAGYVSLAVPTPAVSSARAHLLSVPVIAAAATRLRDFRGGERPSADRPAEKTADRSAEEATDRQADRSERRAASRRAREFLAGTFAADALANIVANLRHIDAIVCGPGILATAATAAFVRSLLDFAAEKELPLLLDADALNVLSACAAAQSEPASLQENSRHLKRCQESEGKGADQRRPDYIGLQQDLIKTRECAQSEPAASWRPPRFSNPVILTPHAGELARLKAAFAIADTDTLARELNAIIVAKGPTTHIVSPQQSQEMAPGTPALATAGTGDVLSGIIASLLAQGLPAWDAALLGVELHGSAGRAAEERLGTRSVLAEDVIAALPQAIQEREAL
jgi:NAD(P)H-hydrate epimerase